MGGKCVVAQSLRFQHWCCHIGSVECSETYCTDSTPILRLSCATLFFANRIVESTLSSVEEHHGNENLLNHRIETMWVAFPKTLIVSAFQLNVID